MQKLYLKFIYLTNISEVFNYIKKAQWYEDKIRTLFSHGGGLIWFEFITIISYTLTGFQ